MKRKLDEREKMEVLKMEQIGFWILFIGLVLSILVQLFFFQAEAVQIAGETVVLLVGGIAVIAGGIRNGQERFGVKHRIRQSILYGLIAAVIADVLLGITLYFRTRGQTIHVKNLAGTLAISLLIIWALASVTLFWMEAASHKRQKKLETLYSEEDALEFERDSKRKTNTKEAETKKKEQDGLKKIASAGNEFQLNTIQELLEEQHIPYVIRDREAGGYMRVYAGNSIFGTDIFVPEEAYALAFETLERFPWDVEVLVKEDNI